MESLWADDTVPAHKWTEARTIWSATRKHLAAQPTDFVAAERLAWLTHALCNTMAARRIVPPSGDPVAERTTRALLEGALEVLVLPRHRQALRGHLARGATRFGDLVSAEQWLAGCDPYSEDLQSDSPYRISRALLETARGRFQEVLALVGRTSEEVPIDDTLDLLASVLRANAWERLGRLDLAIQGLERVMLGSSRSRAVEAAIAALPASWQLCARSLVAARSRAKAAIVSHAGEEGGGKIVGWLVLISCCSAPLIVLAVALGHPGPFEWASLSVLLFPAIGGSMGWVMIRSSNRATFIATHGQPLQGTIVAMEPTGGRINGVPLIRVVVMVQVPDRAPVRASTTRCMIPNPGLIGTRADVRWHPDHPDRCVVESL